MYFSIKLISTFFGLLLSVSALYSLIKDPKPNIAPLSTDNSFSDSYSSSTTKFGYKHRNFMSSPGNPNSLIEGINDDWWNWVYENIWKPKKPSSGKFSPVTLGFSQSDSNALNKVCDAAYNSESSKVTETGTNTDEYKTEDVWTFCSLINQKPKLLKEVTTEYTGSQLGVTKKDVLVSFDPETTETFWKVRDEEASTISKFTGFTIEDSDKYFKKQNKPISEICKSAYSLEKGTTSSETQPTEAEVIKYCSLSSPDMPKTKQE